MAILPIDGGRYGTKEMISIFKEQNKIDLQLEIEGAAAISQSEIGVIPKIVGKNILKAAKSGKITAKRIKQLEAKSDHDRTIWQARMQRLLPAKLSYQLSF